MKQTHSFFIGLAKFIPLLPQAINGTEAFDAPDFCDCWTREAETTAFIQSQEAILGIELNLSTAISNKVRLSYALSRAIILDLVITLPCIDISVDLNLLDLATLQADIGAPRLPCIGTLIVDVRWRRFE